MYFTDLYDLCLDDELVCSSTSEVEDTSAPFVNFTVSVIHNVTATQITYLKSCSYLTRVPAGKLQRHLSNIIVILNRERVFNYLVKLGKQRNV